MTALVAVAESIVGEEVQREAETAWASGDGRRRGDGDVHRQMVAGKAMEDAG
jgi:hypothetical protein